MGTRRVVQYHACSRHNKLFTLATSSVQSVVPHVSGCCGSDGGREATPTNRRGQKGRKVMNLIPLQVSGKGAMVGRGHDGKGQAPP